MGLAGIAQRLFERGERLSPKVLKAAKPLRNALVEEQVLEDGSLLLQITLSSQGKGMLGALAKYAKVPDRKSFELEPIGAFVWGLCDGQNSFESISRKLRDKFKMNRVESEAALTAFLQMLSQRRLITMMVKKR